MSMKQQSDISYQLKALAARWFSLEYSKAFTPAKILDSLIVYAFMNRIEEGYETRLLREAHKRLQDCNLTGEYVDLESSV